MKDYFERLDQDHIHLTTRPYLNKVLKHTEPYEVEIFGERVIVLPQVMSPAYDWAGHFMIECLPKNLSGKEVLELGSGCGLVSVFAGLRGADSVTAVDINPEAVKNTALNFERFCIPHAQVILSDVFEHVPRQTFDVIIFNLPYHDSQPKNQLEKGVMDSDYRVMHTFLQEARSYLKTHGKLYVGFSRSGDVPRFLRALRVNGFFIEGMVEKDCWDQDPRFSGPDGHYNCQVYRLSAFDQSV